MRPSRRAVGCALRRNFAAPDAPPSRRLLRPTRRVSPTLASPESRRVCALCPHGSTIPQIVPPRGLIPCLRMSSLSRIGVAIDTELLDKFDHLIGQRGYTNRSEAFRDLIRDELVEK